MRKVVSFLFILFSIISVNTKAQNVIVKGGSYDAFEINNGILWGWGYNYYAALGTGDINDRISPVRIGIASNWEDIYPGDTHTVGKTSDGKLWVWGSNGYGALGQGYWDATIINVPNLLGSDNDWLTAAAGVHHTLAIKNDGSLWSWGSNDGGQLGYETYYNNSNHNTYLPVRIGSDTWRNVSAGYHFSLGVKSDGTLWEWGNNSDIVKNEGVNTINSIIPKQVGTEKDWAKVSAGYYHALAIKADGTLWAWGDNRWAQLGIGSNVPYVSAPVKVGNENNWLTVSGAKEHTLAVKTNGTLWAWGGNSDGELGNGMSSSVVFQYSPAQVGSETNWSSHIYANGTSSYASKIDNTVWSWGQNGYGQLGIGKSYSIERTLQQVLLPENLPLPASMLNFSISKQSNKNIVRWITTEESKVHRFEIERSKEGIYFSTVGVVKAIGNSNTDHKYDFEDNSPINGKAFYRLKIIDIDNKYSYSKIASVNNELNENSFLVFPNPAQNIIKINLIITTVLPKVSIEVIDMVGRKVIKKEVRINNNTISANIDLSSLQPGYYFMYIPELNKISKFRKE